MSQGLQLPPFYVAFVLPEQVTGRVWSGDRMKALPFTVPPWYTLTHPSVFWVSFLSVVKGKWGALLNLYEYLFLTWTPELP